MNKLEKSTRIKSSLRKGFRDGSSKMARRRCYGYSTAPDGRLGFDPTEAETVLWVFQRYLDGDSLGKIAASLEKQGILSPTGKLKWNRETINKLLSNEKYTGRVLLQKTISTGTSQIENNGLMEQYLYTDSHEAIISDELFEAAQQEKMRRSKFPKHGLSITQMF